MADNLQLLYHAYAREIRAGLRRRGALPELAEDLTHDTFLRALIATSPPIQPRAWFWRTALNLFIDHKRRERLVDWVHLGDEAFDKVIAQLPETEDYVWHRQRLALTASALLELPERSRRAFVLFRLERKTIATVAEDLDLSVSRSWTLVRDAYLHVRKRLGETP